MLPRSSKERTVCLGHGAAVQAEGAGARVRQSPTRVRPCAPLPPPWLPRGGLRERERRGEKKKKSPHQTGQNIELSEPSALGPGQGVRGEIFTFLQAKEGRAGGWREGWERVKENKLLLPLNIHDSSFAKANGKHINPFTTLLNAKRKEKKENKMDEGHSLLWANWKEYENLDHRRLEAQGEESGLWVLFRPVPVGVDTSLIHFPSLQ